MIQFKSHLNFVHDACHYDKNKTNKNPIFALFLLFLSRGKSDMGEAGGRAG
jgi:hypothetical protein